MLKTMKNKFQISNKNDLDKSFINICTLLELNSSKINAIPDDVIEFHNYIVNIKINPKELAFWCEIAKTLELALTNFSNHLIKAENGVSVSEDWFVAQKEKHIFRMMILYEFDTDLGAKLEKLSNLFNKAEGTDLHSYSLSALGYQMDSMQSMLSFLKPIVDITRKCFINLTNNQNLQCLTYGEVLGSAIKRVFSHISPDTPLNNQSNFSKLRAILPGNNLPTKVDQPSKIWKYTQEKKGPSLSNLQRKFLSFIEQVKSSLPNDDEHIKNTAVNDIKISEGLFLLALLHIKKIVQQKNLNLVLQDREIRIPANILTSEYQNNIIHKDVWMGLSQELVTFCEKHAHLKENDQRKYSAQNDIKLNNYGNDMEVGLNVSITSTPSTPLNPANSEQLHTPKKGKKTEQQVLNVELTPKKTNIRIFYEDGSESIVPLEALANIQIAPVHGNQQQRKMTNFGKKQNERQNSQSDEKIQNKEHNDVSMVSKF